jgi:lipoprotein NlpD
MEKVGGQLIRIAQPGDSLHGIAFAAGLNVNQLAAWNGVADTSRLQIGQRIRLTQPLGFVDEPRKKNGVHSQVAKPPIKTKPAGSPSPTIASTPPKKVSNPAAAGDPNKASRVSATAVRWRWPLHGKLIGRFNIGNGAQGIDIQAKVGDPVTATAAGQVVYVGNGLKGYGNLVIIKHSDRYLSAYAHNVETFVREGEKVPDRHVVASVGKNQQRVAALHFQIRKDGDPVNPLLYLPAR